MGLFAGRRRVNVDRSVRPDLNLTDDEVFLGRSPMPRLTLRNLKSTGFAGIDPIHDVSTKK